MIDRDTKMPIVRQCKVLDLSRSSVYYPPRTLPEADPSEANTALERYFRFYNARGSRQGLDDLTPDAVYFAKTELRQAA